MSAWLMPTCGRPGSVSSILTEMTGDRGTAPSPVNGFLAAGGAGVVGAALDVVGTGLVGTAEAVFFGLLSPPQAAALSTAVTASDAVSRRSGREKVMRGPLPWEWAARPG